MLNYFPIWSPARANNELCAHILFNNLYHLIMKDAGDYKNPFDKTFRSDTLGHQSEVGRQTGGSRVVEWPDRYRGTHLPQQKEIFSSCIV